MAGKLWDKGYEPDKMIEEYTVGDDRELDMRLARYDVEGSLAHIAMLETIGLLTAEELEKLTAGLKEIAAEIEAGRLREPLCGKQRADMFIITKCPEQLIPWVKPVEAAEDGSWKEASAKAFRVIVRGLRAVFAVLRTAAAATVDDRAEVDLVADTGLSDLVRTLTERL